MWGFSGGSVVKNPPTNQHRRCEFDPWVRKIPRRRKWPPTPVFLLGEFHGQRSLMGYSPWGLKRVRHDWMTNTHAYTHTHTHTHTYSFSDFSCRILSVVLYVDPCWLFYISVQFQFSCVWLFATPWTAARQASLSITNSRSWLKPCPLSWWCYPTISSSVVPFSSCLQSFPASGSFQMSQFFPSGGQTIGALFQHQSFQWISRTDFL